MVTQIHIMLWENPIKLFKGQKGVWRPNTRLRWFKRRGAKKKPKTPKTSCALERQESVLFGPRKISRMIVGENVLWKA